jgi:hypothetical protein
LSLSLRFVSTSSSSIQYSRRAKHIPVGNQGHKTSFASNTGL